MIDFILKLIKTCIAILPILMLCMDSKKVNLEKPERSKQFLMPPIAIFYSIVVMIFLNPINTWLLRLLLMLPRWIVALGNLSWMPDAIRSVLYQVSSFLTTLLTELNLNFWIFYLANVVIIVVYLILKRICIAIMKNRIKTDSKLHQSVAGMFYEYFMERGKWCIREDYVQARKLLKVFYISAMSVSFLLMLASSDFYHDKLLRTVFYPVFGIIIVGELYFYLDGATSREYTKDILGEEEDSYKTVNYSLLRRFLRSLFQDKLLTENTSVNHGLLYGVTNDEVIQNLEKNEDPKIATFASYVKALNATGFQLDHNYLSSALDLLNGKSILFNNPFYNDLIPYAFYPMNRVLLSHRKVLVVLGRHAIEDDIQKWLEEGIEAITNIPFLWNIGVLSEEQQDLDIGILTRSDVLNMRLQDSNSHFLSQVGYVVIIEPSKLIATAQIGLNLLVKQCRQQENNDLTYCLCDKNCDGLVDAMSHILMTSITEVSATKKHMGTSSYMCWEADSEYLHHRLVPNISRYLGIGTELSFAALKNQVSKTKWYGGENFPVKDINWINKQYYFTLMKYAGLPTSQEAMEQHFMVSPNFWSAKVDSHNYFTVEDESHNMFEILRSFATRSTQQGFINVISTEYLLKDYMADNASIFETDAKAIPYIVADYARTSRNTILRLVLMMSTIPVNEEILKKELSLMGIHTYSLREQLWYELYKCYATVADVASLPENYKEAVAAVRLRELTLGGENIDISIFKESERFNVKSGRVEMTYAINHEEFIAACIHELKSAGYVAEDEKGEKNYLGAELSGHIYQKYLPGQFFTFGGKYYEMQYLTADNQVLVRRAADHINGRPTYRQIREYTISGMKESDQIGAKQNISGMIISKIYADIKVDTPGYYQMERYNDFKTAKKISFEGNKNGIPQRSYRNKEVLKIEFEGGEALLYTITTLMNEIFRTLFAENQPYICALTGSTFAEEQEKRNPLTYSLKAENCELSPNAIYIVEDSQLDLGLIIAVERNLNRIFQMLHDYLEWNKETLEESLVPTPDPVPPIEFAEPEEETEPKKKKGLFKRIGEKIKNGFKKLFGKKKKETPAVQEEEEKPVNFPMESQELPEEDQKEEEMFARKPYHERYYMLYGYEEEPAEFDLNGTLEYLGTIGYGQNPLKQAREGKEIAEYVEATFKPAKAGARYCDFCGAEIYGVEYETLADGRERCMNCSNTAVKTEEEFRKIFEDVRRNMESFFGIKLNAGIHVEMVNSQTLHKRLGQAFIPTPGADGRVLGVAISDRKKGYTLMLENGSPRMASMLTMAHELTHIWQYMNWNDKAIRRKYGKKLRLQIYEGMAKWVEIQYAYLINEPAVAKREEIITSYRQDEYGFGFLRYLANYPFSLGTVITRPTPFMNVETPLDPQFCGPIRRKIPDVPTSGDDGNGKSGGKTGKKRKPLPGKKERNPEKVHYYAFGLLSDVEKQAYEAMLEGIRSYAGEVTNLPANMTSEQILRVSEYIDRDHPELFWFQHGTTVYSTGEGQTVEKVAFTYRMTKEEMQERQAKIDAALNAFIAGVDEKMSDYELVLRIFENIIRLVDYDSIGLEKQKADENRRTKPDDLRSIYGVFVNKKAVCAGYAKATQYLLQKYGIECTYVVSDKHAWNILKLEGDYYHMDTTWGDHSNTNKELNQSDEISYEHFCITTEEVLRLDQHQPVEELPLPNCTAIKCNYFYRQGLYFEKYDFNRMREIAQELIENGVLKIAVKCASDRVYEESMKHLVTEHKFREIIQYVNLKNNAKLSTTYSYSGDEKNRIINFWVKKEK